MFPIHHPDAPNGDIVFWSRYKPQEIDKTYQNSYTTRSSPIIVIHKVYFLVKLGQQSVHLYLYKYGQ